MNALYTIWDGTLCVYVCIDMYVLHMTVCTRYGIECFTILANKRKHAVSSKSYPFNLLWSYTSWLYQRLISKSSLKMVAYARDVTPYLTNLTSIPLYWLHPFISASIPPQKCYICSEQRRSKSLLRLRELSTVTITVQGLWWLQSCKSSYLATTLRIPFIKSPSLLPWCSKAALNQTGFIGHFIRFSFSGSSWR